jgi:hypothetical protein
MFIDSIRPLQPHGHDSILPESFQASDDLFIGWQYRNNDVSLLGLLFGLRIFVGRFFTGEICPPVKIRRTTIRH